MKSKLIKYDFMITETGIEYKYLSEVEIKDMNDMNFAFNEWMKPRIEAGLPVDHAKDGAQFLREKYQNEIDMWISSRIIG